MRAKMWHRWMVMIAAAEKKTKSRTTTETEQESKADRQTDKQTGRRTDTRTANGQTETNEVKAASMQKIRHERQC